MIPFRSLLNSFDFRGVLFWPGERRISPAEDKKKSLIRRPRFFIRRPKGIFTAIITPIELRTRRTNFRNSQQPI